MLKGKEKKAHMDKLRKQALDKQSGRSNSTDDPHSELQHLDKMGVARNEAV